MAEDDDDEISLEKDPIQFYVRKKKGPVIDKPVGKYLFISAALLFLATIVVGAGLVWYVLHKDAMSAVARGGNGEIVLDRSANLPRFHSKEQRRRLSDAVVVSVSPDKIVVYADDKHTTVLIDDKCIIEKKGDTLPLGQYQANMEQYLKDIQFGPPNTLFVIPDPFAHEAASLQDIHVHTSVNVIPTNDSPDGDVIRGRSLLILD